MLYHVLNEANIGSLRGFSLKFRMVSGTIRGNERDYVRKLSEHSTRVVRMGTDYLLVFDLTERDYFLANKIIDNPGGGLTFFEDLVRLATPRGNDPPILQALNLFLERSLDSGIDDADTAAPLHLLEWLSDGEQSFLGRMCLFALLGDRESLILLDEPEVHFNDYWKRQIVYLIDKVLQRNSSHALITTHSSITLTDVPKRDIIVLDRKELYTSDAFNPSIETLAADPSDIIVHVFGAPQATGAKSIDLIRQALSNRPGQSTTERRVRLNELREQVGVGYWSYRIRKELLEMESR